MTIEGRSSIWSRRGDEGGKAVFHSCPVCAATVYWQPEAFPDLVAVAVGAFADPEFPAPNVAVYESRRHAWTTELGALPLEHWD